METRILSMLGDNLYAAGDAGSAGDAWRQALEIRLALRHRDAEELLDKLRSLSGK
ncbi:MAG TPA: hypothetical protein VFC19_45430 [Candidatus Limnocylindrales bacterium]|nr:hypothetical protein [Candidatus Limnocylindrales bacterium]